MTRRAAAVGLVAALAGATLASGALPGDPAAATPAGVLRVCSDPNNLPFSNRAGQGFENRLAELVAAELGAQVRYTWWAQRRGFVRNTLGAGACDLIPGVPAGYELVATTEPYYRSTYVFVTRRDLSPAIESIDDPRLHRLRIGVHLIGDDYAAPPPATALARRGIVDNVRGYSLYGDYREPNPPARLVEAVAKGEVDVALVWGPLGGYFAERESAPLRVTPLLERGDGPGVPFVFDIAMGVRRGDSALARRVGTVLDQRRTEVRRILERYGVPLVPGRPKEAT
ncbi:MAG TPA: substrate-binding domain-containing protein [Gemmatimonadales bacterium]|nr:substrate-binding domain-containing protein [Gemmatimonadales bacterium]